jgi:hypothetical protein
MTTLTTILIVLAVWLLASVVLTQPAGRLLERRRKQKEVEMLRRAIVFDPDAVPPGAGRSRIIRGDVDL